MDDELSSEEQSGVSERLAGAEAAERAGVSLSTLRRWVALGLFPKHDVGQGWGASAIAQARSLVKLRERGYSIEQLQEAVDQGRIVGYGDELVAEMVGERFTLKQAAKASGLKAEVIAELIAATGLPSGALDDLGSEDVEIFKHFATAIESGFPRDALLQTVRVYGQAASKIADAEVRLVHLHVHEPLLRKGVSSEQITDQMGTITGELLPLFSPVIDHLHRRFLNHFVEQDIVGHMENEPGGEIGQVRVAIAFADLAGYTQLTEEVGDEEAAGIVERFVANVNQSLPDEARILKTIGDEVMIVSPDAGSLIDWAVGFQILSNERPLPRIGIHSGNVVFRDGDYFGREVNLAARVAARAAAGEVLVTWPVVEMAGKHLQFERIGEVKLKGFSHATELFLADPAGEN
ncbi:MAG: MerR family transcriptional regulator [Solirubrobacteraceae bacterium]|nr:MerR family transcriptional regulator [Solirubrobacteraceae bacterium]